MSGAAGSTSPAPLRRLDWRFLLPRVPGEGYEHLVVLGGDEAVVEALQGVGIAARVSTDAAAAEGGADLIAVLNGAPFDARELAGALRPGGVLYVERRPVDGGGRRLPAFGAARSLEAAGLEVFGHYAVLPGHDAAKVYLPLGAPAALRWVARTVVPPDGPFRRALRAVLRLPGGASLHRALALYPAQVLLAARPPLASGVAGALLVAGPDACAAPQGARPVLLCDAGNRVVLLPFLPGSPEPGGVIKVPKRPVFNGRTCTEHDSLRRIRGQVPAELLEALPEPRSIRPAGGIAVATESYVRGTPLLASSGGWRARWSSRSADLSLAARWLADFHAAAPLERTTWDEGQRTRWIEEPIDAYRSAFGTTSAEERLFAELGRRAAELDGLPFALVWWHRDYNVWNLFRDGDALRVIDWEGARPGPPLCDLLHFCTHWHEAVHGLEGEPERLEGFRDLFAHRGRRSRAAAAVDSALAGYLDRVGLDARFLPVLLAFTWIELALRRAEQLRDQGVPREDPRAHNRNFPYVDVLASAIAPAGAPGGDPRPIRPGVERADAEPPVLDASVVIASRGRAAMLRDSVRSLLGGDALPAELIVVDQSDAPDPELETMAAPAGCDLRYLSRPGRGLSRANNLAARLARHELLVFTHDDVLVTAGWLAAIVAAVRERSGRTVATGRILATSEDGGGYAPTLRTGTEARVWAGPVLYDVLKPLNMAMTRSVLTEVGGFDERLGPGTPFPGAEDADLGHRLLAAGCTVVYVPEALLYHRAWRAESDFLTVRWGYGLAQGAFYAKHIRWRDLHIPKRIAKDVLRRVRRFPSRLVRERARALGDPLFVAGNVLGALRWIRLHRRGGAP